MFSIHCNTLQHAAIDKVTHFNRHCNSLANTNSLHHCTPLRDTATDWNRLYNTMANRITHSITARHKARVLSKHICMQSSPLSINSAWNSRIWHFHSFATLKTLKSQVYGCTRGLPRKLSKFSGSRPRSLHTISFDIRIQKEPTASAKSICSFSLELWGGYD